MSQKIGILIHTNSRPIHLLSWVFSDKNLQRFTRSANPRVLLPNPLEQWRFFGSPDLTSISKYILRVFPTRGIFEGEGVAVLFGGLNSPIMGSWRCEWPFLRTDVPSSSTVKLPSASLVDYPRLLIRCIRSRSTYLSAVPSSPNLETPAHWSCDEAVINIFGSFTGAQTFICGW